MEELTQLIHQSANGDKASFEKAYAILYKELKNMTRAIRFHWKSNETLNTTALLHDAYIKLYKANFKNIESQRHFMNLVAQAIRQIIMTHINKKVAEKRGGVIEKIAYDDEISLNMDNEISEEIYLINQALQKLESTDETYGKLITCRFFAGMSIEDTAEAMNSSPSTIKRKWKFAKTYLFKELKESGS